MSVELLETQFPELIHRANFVTDSGGPGKWRGGVGMVYEIEAYGGKIEYVKGGCGQLNPVDGVLGGKSGTICRHWKGPIGKVKYGRALEVGFAAKGRLLGIEMMGGGGVGNPLERDPELVIEDIKNEYITIECARKEYGIVINPDTLKINEEETRKLRESLLD
jgi:N-methylhydantoinase B